MPNNYFCMHNNVSLGLNTKNIQMFMTVEIHALEEAWTF